MKSDQKRMHIRSNAFENQKHHSLNKNLMIIKGETNGRKLSSKRGTSSFGGVAVKHFGN